MKYSKEDIINVPDDYEGTKCPPSERFTYDPYLESNIINRFFFHWACTILRMSKKYRLTPSDLGKPSKKNDSHYFAQKLHRIWDDLGYKNKQSHALFKTVLRSNACSLIIVMILSALQAGLDYFSVIITKEFIDYFDKSGKKGNSSFSLDLPLWVLGLLFLGTQIFKTFFNLHTQMIQTNFGNRAGYELNCFIYNKILNYAPSGFIQRANHGEIINFIQIDSMRLSFLVSLAPNACVAPMMIGAYIYLLFDFFGLTFISGLVVLLSFMVSNYFIAKEFRKRQKLMMGKKDACMKVTTETLENIKILKLYNWENEFKNKILNARRIEMDFMANRYMISNINQTINWLCPTLVSIVTIGFYQLFNDSFNISTMLIGLSIFSKLQGPVRMLPNIINQTLETTVSLKRIEDFLKQPDIDKNLIKRGNYDENGEYAIKIDGGNFSWGVKQKKKSRWDLPGKKKKGMDKIKDIKINEENNIINDPDNNENALLPSSEDERSSISVSKDKAEKIKGLGNEEGNEIEIDGCKIQIPIPKGIDYDITLKNIKFEVKPGELVAIVGEVG
jgi:ABC-type multidrug transport system fused ATPase/permease subunit